MAWKTAENRGQFYHPGDATHLPLEPEPLFPVTTEAVHRGSMIRGFSMCACSRLLCSLHARFIVSYNFMNERGGGRRSAVQRFSIIDIRLSWWWWRRRKSSCRVASTHPEVENGMTRPYGGKSASSLNSSPSTTRVKVFHLFVVGVSQRCTEITKNCAFYISFFFHFIYLS